ncbi:uncharacterized protein LOC129951158 [Eupeodes corollae]|uniref:uncharacterized protein LOC129951158 n=1 Tax=Eupeodes corollae TaxID=290404 RepID=UPI002491E7CB|nr:uncharacterized protein LOC129951158 [Eupeodes corollae]
MKSNGRTYVPETISETTSNDKYLLLLKFIDISVSSVIVGPCVIAYWRGTWELMELILFPQNAGISALISFGLGVFGHIFFTLCQNSFKKSFDPDKRRLTYYLGSRGYTAIFGIICVNMWRGAWNLCDLFTSRTSLGVIVILTLIAICLLIVTKTSRNLTAAPFVVATDQRQNYFDISTFFNTHKFHRPGLYILDTFFSAIFVGTLVVIAWRGVWESLDIVFYRKNAVISAIASLIIGYGVTLITFVLQPIFRWICGNSIGRLKLFLADTYYLMSFMGSVNVWRGIWMLLDIYLYPDSPLKSCLISHLVPFLILTFLNCVNSILVRGTAVDGDDVEFPIDYVKLHLQHQRSRKYAKKLKKDGISPVKERETLM